MSQRAVLTGLVLGAVVLGGAWWLATRPAEPPSTARRPTAVATASPTPTVAATTPGTTPSPTPTPTPAAGTPSPPRSPTPDRTAAGTEPSPPATVAAPTASPAEPPGDAGRLEGTAEASDPTGDLHDSAGQPPPQPEPASDLTGVRLGGDGSDLVVSWSAAGDVPASADSLVWSLDLWSDGTQRYTVTVQQIGARRVAGVLDWSSGEQRDPGAPEVEGASVTVRVPGALLADIEGPFQWQALGQQDGGYEDYVPADGVLTWFPSG